jgi:hypothetical protein
MQDERSKNLPQIDVGELAREVVGRTVADIEKCSTEDETYLRITFNGGRVLEVHGDFDVFASVTLIELRFGPAHGSGEAAPHAELWAAVQAGDLARVQELMAGERSPMSAEREVP